MTLSDGAQRAAAAVVQHPLRWSDAETDPDPDPGRVMERGWFLGADECARCLSRLAEAPSTSAWAFGGKWPVVRGGGGWLVAPGVPLALDGRGEDAVDGVYGLREGSVWREAAGRERCLVAATGASPRPGRPFDLMWFGDAERMTVRNRVLEVEDLFARLEVSADPALLEKLLVRGRRVAPEVLDGVGTAENRANPPRMTVHRSATLFENHGWRDPLRFLSVRSDVDQVASGDDTVDIHTVTGEKVIFRSTQREAGWELCLVSGDYPLTAVWLEKKEDAISLVAEIHPIIDPMAPGMRGRIAFDLRSDLVALGEKAGT